MKRREFFGVIGGAAAMLPLAARAQQPDRMRRIGIIVNAAADAAEYHSWVEAFFPGVGWIPFDPTPSAGLTGGKNLDLAWAPHVFNGDGGQQGPSKSVNVSSSPRDTRSSGPSSGLGATSNCQLCGLVQRGSPRSAAAPVQTY